MRTTLVSHGNTLLAPLVRLILCVPRYVDDTMLLGEVTQSAAAFVAVQGAFNWLVNNYPRLAEWLVVGQSGRHAPQGVRQAGGHGGLRAVRALGRSTGRLIRRP
jgi:hypothetical protein